VSIVIDMQARANLRRNLKKTVAGLHKGMKPSEIRDLEIWQTEALIRHAAGRLLEQRSSRTRVAAFLRLVASEIEL